MSQPGSSFSASSERSTVGIVGTDSPLVAYKERADWPWSSAHLLACDDRLVQVVAMLAMVNDWRAFLDSAMSEEHLPNHARTGRPPGDATFVERLEKLVGRVLRPRKPGRKPKFPK